MDDIYENISEQINERNVKGKKKFSFLRKGNGISRFGSVCYPKFGKAKPSASQGDNQTIMARLGGTTTVVGDDDLHGPLLPPLELQKDAE